MVAKMHLGKTLLFILVLAILLAGGYWGISKFGDGPVAEADNIPAPEPEKPILDPNILMPDLIPLPPADVKIDKRADANYLLFSTTYYNPGRGNFELRADPATKGVRADIERDVVQRVYNKDGSYTDSLVGNFLWHQEHLHYHYADFITYDLSVVDAPTHEDLEGYLTKSTFCLRDVSKVIGMEIENARDEADYKICGKELQGVSVGWGDTYYYDYPGQALNISSLSSGTYKLEFEVNPNRRLQELDFDNNIAWAIFKLDVEAGSVEVLERFPAQTPEIEHVHLEDPFGMQYNVVPR